MDTLSIILVGLVTGGATGIWLLLGVGYWKGHRIASLGFFTLSVATLVSTYLVWFRLRGGEVAPSISTVLLLVLFGLPPVMQLYPFLKLRKFFR